MNATPTDFKPMFRVKLSCCGDALKRESGHWNRAGRRSGGDRAARIPVALSGRVVAGQAVLGPCCLLGRHDLCRGECVCKCHGRPTEGT